MTRLFVYGTLMFPDVFQAVTGYQLLADESIFEGYARYLVRDQSYPGIVPEDDASVVGLTTEPLSPVVVSTLDRFEGDHYARKTVMVGEVACDTYVFRDRSFLTDREWDPSTFTAMQRADFLDQCRRFRITGATHRNENH